MTFARPAWLRNSTAFRFVALYVALNLAALIPLFGFIYQATDRLVLEESRRAVEEHVDLLDADYRSGGADEVARSITAEIGAGAAAHAAFLLVDPSGRPRAGNLRAWPPNLRAPARWAEIRLYRAGHARPESIGLSASVLPDGHRLLVGRVMDDRTRLREALILALGGAVLLAFPLGLLGSAVLLRFMNQRVRAIASVTSQAAAGDLSGRIEARGTNDPFDQLAASVNAMLGQLERLVEELRIVTDGLAHDLRSPLMRMRAATDRAMIEGDAASSKRALDAVARESESMLRMLTATLEVSRAEAGIGRESFEVFDVAHMARDLCEMYQPLAQERGVAIEVEAPETVPFSGNRELLGQATSNLIDNALKYGSDGGSIRLSVESDGERVRLGVADRGPGIPAELRDQALLRYRRLDSARTAEGSGLGLSLAGAVARLHGGDIFLQDNEPGLRVVLDLPVGNHGDIERQRSIT